MRTSLTSLMARKRPSPYSRDTLVLFVLPLLAIVLALLGVTLAVWKQSKTAYEQQRSETIAAENIDLSQAIKVRLKAYQEVLQGTSSLFAISQRITSQDFKSYIDSLQLGTRYPGVRGIGFSPCLNHGQYEHYGELLQSETDWPPVITPAGDRDTYCPTVYFVRDNGDNSLSVGYDMFSDPIRRAAMQKASATNQTVISDKIILFTDQQNNLMFPGFNMYVPVYTSGMPLSTPSQRSSALRGYVSASFRAKDLFGGIFNNTSIGQSAIKIHDGNDASRPGSKLFESRDYEQLGKDDATLHSHSVVNIFSHSWIMDINTPGYIIPQEVSSRPQLILVTGLVSTLLIVIIIAMLLINRSSLLRASSNQEVLNAKDELLSLAAHQLRTPATAVKQYIGILREGYSGSLTREQANLIEKAYESNERQIRTVNEMLYVAKADVGKLRMFEKTFDLKVMVKEVADELMTDIRQYGHTAKVSVPSRAAPFYGDELFLRMALTNLISNAAKYTPKKGKIGIRLDITASQYKISVKDNGVGIDEKDFKMLFQKFLRIDNPLTTEVIGSGLGLYLARKLVELHKGSIDARSKLNKGSTFTIFLPRPLHSLRPGRKKHYTSNKEEGVNT